MSLSIHISKEAIEEELKKFQPLTPGWYEGEVLSVVAEPAKDKASMNYVTMFKVSNKEIKNYFNSKPGGQTSITKFFAAINNLPVQEFLAKLEAEFDLNFDNTKGKKVMVKIIHALAKDGSGKIFSNIDDFAPLGKVPF